MRYAIIKNDKIENVIIADEEFIANNHPDAVVCPDGFGVGDGFIEGEFFTINTEAEIV